MSKRVAFAEEAGEDELAQKKRARTDDGDDEDHFERDYGEEGDEDDLADDLQQGSKRNRRFRMDGYQSDDSDDGKAAKRGAGAEVDDMFGEGDAEDKKKDKKEVKFMRRGDIEGQEWDAAAAEYEDDGTKIEPFNMDEELEEGAFDEAGMYIRKKDEFAHHDNWLQGTTKEDIEKARVARQRQEERAKVENRRVQETNKAVNQTDVWKHLLTLLKPGENILAALRRLGGAKQGKKKMSWAEKTKAKQAAEAADDADPEARRNRVEMEAITAIADKMMSFGVFNIYEDTYEQIMRKLRIDEAIDEFWEPGQDPPPQSLFEAIPELKRVDDVGESA